MYKRYYNSTEEIRLREQSNVMLEEVSSGIYHVKKDLTGHYKGYTESINVIFALNNEEKVAVSGRSGVYANFELI